MDLQELQRTFGTIARSYDGIRPSYPPEVVARCRARLAPDLPLTAFEIGCGSGQATELFLRDGFHVVASDISDDLIRLARQRLAAYPAVSYQVGAFEDLPLAHSTYALVLAAQAFHWVNATVGIPKVYGALLPNGSAAFFWNFIHYDATPRFRHVCDRLLAIVPDFAHWPDATEERFAQFAASWVQAFALAPFADYRQEVIGSALLSTPERFCQLIATYSWFRVQDEAQQAAILDAVRLCFPSPSEEMVIPLRTLLVSARKPTTP